MAIIGLDVDGVLVSFEAGYAPLLTKETGLEFPDVGQPDWPPTWYWERDAMRAAGFTPSAAAAAELAVWQQIKTDSEFWLRLPAHPDADRFLSWLCDYRIHDDIYFITHRMGVMAKEQTEDWLDLHGWDRPATVLISGDKGACCKALKVDYYIDDKLENCQDVLTKSPFTKTFMRARGYNHNIEGLAGRGDLLAFRQLIEEA